MARVSTYLNFPGNTEEAFNFYKSIFNTEFQGEIMRLKDVPQNDTDKPLSEEDKNLIMNVALPILGGHILMGTDATESQGFSVKFGNNSYICLETDSREETDRLFNALSEGGKIEMPLEDMFWGDYFGTCSDKFGVQWMFVCSSK